MTVSITNTIDEALFNAYLLARNGPRDAIRHGVTPNCANALNLYLWLLTALSGGDVEAGIPDMSAFATYHANATAQVTPFIALMQKCMALLVQTPALINQAAVAQGIAPPFGAEINTPVDLAEYGALLAATVAAIQGVAAAAQQMGQGE